MSVQVRNSIITPREEYQYELFESHISKNKNFSQNKPKAQQKHKISDFTIFFTKREYGQVLLKVPYLCPLHNTCCGKFPSKIEVGSGALKSWVPLSSVQHRFWNHSYQSKKRLTTCMILKTHCK